MCGAAQARPHLSTDPALSAGYLPTAVCITCHEPQHRGFMTSVRQYRRQTQRRGILSFSRVHTTRQGLWAMWGYTAETAWWYTAAIQSNTPVSTHRTGRVIFMPSAEYQEIKCLMIIKFDTMIIKTDIFIKKSDNISFRWLLIKKYDSRNVIIWKMKQLC